MPADILNILMPEQCTECKKQFADELTLQRHSFAEHKQSYGTGASKIIPSTCSKEDLKKYLNVRGLNVTGNKPLLIKRLEGAVANEI